MRISWSCTNNVAPWTGMYVTGTEAIQDASKRWRWRIRNAVNPGPAENKRGDGTRQRNGQSGCMLLPSIRLTRFCQHKSPKNSEKAPRETQTLRACCSKAEPKIFAPPQTTSRGHRTAKI